MHLSCNRSLFFLSPEHGGDVVSGGGYPANSSVPASEAIDDAFGQSEAIRGKILGVGVPGSKDQLDSKRSVQPRWPSAVAVQLDRERRLVLGPAAFRA